MNRPLVMTLLAMVASVAAAVATPEVDAAPRADCADGKGTLPSLSALSSPTLPVRRQAEAPVAPCSAAVDDPYLRWHHGSLKLMPACAAPAQT